MIERSWDNAWEKVFKCREWGKYPAEELVRFIARNYYKVPDRKRIRILDVGCGTGAAAWYIAREGFSAYGIDGSNTAIKIARERFRKEELKGKFKVGDMITLDYPKGYFDCVIDVCAIQHNKTEAVKKILREIRRVLKPGGKIFSMLLSTRTKLKGNLYTEYGYTNFFTKKGIKKLFRDFNNLHIERTERTDNGNLIAHFIVTAEK